LHTDELPWIIQGIIDNLPREFNQVWNSLQKEEKEKYTGGYFCLTDVDNPECPRFMMYLPTLFPERQSKCFRLSLEKAQRLLEHPTDCSSWQSRNQNDSKWGGAVRWGDFAFSFSGLPELKDEALMLYLLHTSRRWPGFLTSGPFHGQLINIARFSGNSYFNPK
jgi:hypothetical protein